MKKIQIKNLSQLSEAAKQFIAQIGENKIFAFTGTMGAGKTTFIKEVCTQLGVTENITSPTFAIINEYEASDKKVIYHFDCYRLKNTQEAYDIGAEEYFYSGNLCFIEWPDRIEELLPNSTVEISILVNELGEREIQIQ